MNVHSHTFGVFRGLSENRKEFQSDTRRDRTAMNTQEHWERIYATKAPDQVSWYCPHLNASLELVERTPSHSLSHFTSASGFWVDGRQPYRYAPERPTTGKVRVARNPPRTQKSGKS